MSARSLGVVYTKSASGQHRGSEHVQRQHAPSDHSAWCWVSRCHNVPQKLLTNSHGNRQPRLRTWLALALLNQFQSFHRCRLVVNSCYIKVAINTERGTTCSASTRTHRPVSASASRLLISPSSPLSNPILERFRHSGHFAVCNAHVNPSAVFVRVGSSITINFLSSCFA